VVIAFEMDSYMFNENQAAMINIVLSQAHTSDITVELRLTDISTNGNPIILQVYTFIHMSVFISQGTQTTSSHLYFLSCLQLYKDLHDHHF